MVVAIVLIIAIATVARAWIGRGLNAGTKNMEDRVTALEARITALEKR